MQVIIFEDNLYDNLYPITLIRPVYDIKTGAFSLKEKLKILLPKKYKLSLNCRKSLEDLVKNENPGLSVNSFDKDDALLINGRIIISDLFLKKLDKLPDDSFISFDNTIVAARISKGKMKLLKDFQSDVLCSENFEPFKLKKIDSDKFKGEYDIINFSWDVLNLFNTSLKNDLMLLFKSVKNKKGYKLSNSLINPEFIYISKSANIYPGSIIDAHDGNVFIDDNVVVEPFSYIKGPVYIGKDCLIKSGAKIYGPASIGWSSKVTGEISGSIFHSCVNKQHDGFIGNSYACPFVNFGADTVTSNLKNNYSKVRVKFNGEQINTNMQFLGSIVGDHTKFGINTMLNTGTIAGIFANVAGGNFPDKQIDSFSWYILGKESV